MAQFDVDEFRVFKDEADDTDIIHTIIRAKEKEDAFYVLDVGNIIRKHRDWMVKIPRVEPHYAVKCNPSPMVVKILATLNASFDCASEGEIEQVMQCGVSTEKIIFANPAKCPSDIKFAKKVGVDKMTVDSEVELLKIKTMYPTAKIIIRIRCDAKRINGISLGTKYGCDPNDEVLRLIKCTKNLGLTLYGYSFHVGSPCEELNAYARGINICKQLINVAKSMGCNDIKLIDIGGGFPGETNFEIDEIANIINKSIEDINPSIHIISEPGRYYVTSAFTLVAYLHTKKIVSDGHQLMRMYYVNCGVYHAFIEELLNLKARHPTSLFNSLSNEKFLSTLWGPTCDSYDCILKDALLPEFHVGDWLIWRDMGAYTISLSCPFNGIKIPRVYPIIRKSEWQALNSINLQQTSMSQIKSNGEVDLTMLSISK